MLDTIRDWKKRAIISILAGIVFCAGWEYGLTKENPQLMAWWGTMYPEFCFATGSTDAKKDSGKGGKAQESNGELKISWWIWEQMEKIPFWDFK